jgi:uncharacterized protein
MIALLDVNVLIALIDTGHAFHHTANDWILENNDLGWASCPLTQNGCIRILSQPGYPRPVAVSQAILTLQRVCSSKHHHFWPDDVSLLDTTTFDHSKVHGPRQLTDLYLLGLAVKHQGRFVTLDGAIALSTVKNASKKNLVVL